MMSVLFMLCAAVYMTTLLLNPSGAASAAIDGLSVWALKVVPALAPCFIGSILLEKSGFLSVVSGAFGRLGPKLLKCSPLAFSAVLLSYFSGFPAGARMIGSMADSGSISNEDGVIAAVAASCASPGFVVGAVGTVMLGGGTAAVILAVSHYLGAVINGVLCGVGKPRADYGNASAPPPEPFFPALTQAVAKTATAMVQIGVSIVFFSVVSRTLFLGSPIGAMALEMTIGCHLAAGMDLQPQAAIALCSAIVSFGGVCVMAQSQPMLGGVIKPGKYAALKLRHALISAAVAYAAAALIL